MLSQSELVLLLKKTLLSELEPACVSTLQNLFECFSAPAGEFLRKQNKFTPGLYILITGSVEVQDPVTHKRLSTLRAADSFGQLSLLFPKLIGPDICVTEDVQFLMLDSGTFRMLELSDPALAVLIIRALIVQLEPIMPALTSAVARVLLEKG